VIAAGLAFQVAASLAAALLVSSSIPRNALAALLVAAMFVVPWIVAADLLQRALACFVAAVGAMKVLQIAVRPARWPPRLRIWHVLDPIDVRQARPVASALDREALARVLVYSLIAALGIFGLLLSSRLASPVQLPARVAFAAAIVYGMAEAASWLVVAAHRLFGLDVPPIHEAPILSRSLQDFWSARWNRVVNGWMREVVFRPLARRRGAALALLAAFVASGLLHAWLAAPIGATAAAMVGTYFLVEGAAVLAERRMGIERWPIAAARAWTVAAVLVPLPLLSEPFLQALGV
jgi:hypothetical protein